jgi:hypothetical protein
MMRTPSHPITDEPVERINPAADPDSQHELETVLVEKGTVETETDDEIRRVENEELLKFARAL